MDAITIGPLLVSLPRLFLFFGVLSWLLAAEWLGRRSGRDLGGWAAGIVLVGFFVARIGYVATHWQSYASDPWSILRVWEGGFSLIAGLATVIIAGVVRFHRDRTALRASAGAFGTALAVWLTATGIHGAFSEPAPPMPNVTLHDLDGETVNTSSLTGRPLVLNLWATWCGPCRDELPMLDRADRHYPGIRFVYVSLGESRATVRRFLSREGLSLARVLVDPEQRLGGYFHVRGTPTTLVFNARGELVAYRTGVMSRPVLDGYLEELD